MAEADHTVLIVDDEEGMRVLLTSMLKSSGFRPVAVPTGEAGVEYVQRNLAPSVVLLDLNLPGISGLEALRRMLAIAPPLKVVIISCLSDVDRVVAAVKLGAVDYLVKPFSNSALEKAIEGCLQEAATEEKNDQSTYGPLPFLVHSAAMHRVRETLDRVAGTDVPVLILGESGVGKEVVARCLHFSSTRINKQFVKVNCAALPSEFLESELFGYEKGAFTGAGTSKAGKFEVAHGGTLFMDEIGEIHPFLQAKLLHVLQDGRYFRLGANKPTNVNVRIIAATNINVQAALKEGKLRQDLYYRLNVFSITVPPLRDRPEDIPFFLDHFLKKSAKGQNLPVSNRMLQCMLRHPWPGNVRELENFVRRLVILGDESLMISELEQAMGAPAATHSAVAMAVRGGAVPSASDPGADKQGGGPRTLRDLKRETERQAIQAALEWSQWRRKEAAKMLNISYKALLYKMRELGLN